MLWVSLCSFEFHFCCFCSHVRVATSVWVCGSTGAIFWTVYSEWFNDQINTFLLKNQHKPLFSCFRLVHCDLNCTFLSFSSHFALGSCVSSGMVAPHLTACMKNDKMGEASVLQNQTTVCNCPPLSSAAQSLSLSGLSFVMCGHPFSKLFTLICLCKSIIMAVAFAITVHAVHCCNVTCSFWGQMKLIKE